MYNSIHDIDINNNLNKDWLFLFHAFYEDDGDLEWTKNLIYIETSNEA